MSHPSWILIVEAAGAEFHGSSRAMSAIPINPIHTSKGRVLVADGVVYVRELEEHDAEVARIVAEADDPVAATSSCLRIGARALRAAHVSVDVDVIERSFADLEHRFETRVNTAVDEIARSTAELLDEDDGAPTGTLGTFRGELEGMLGDTFDSDSKTSVLAKIEELVLGTMRGLITPELDDSPIGRLRKELVDTVHREGERRGRRGPPCHRAPRHRRRHRRRLRADHREGLRLRRPRR